MATIYKVEYKNRDGRNVIITRGCQKDVDDFLYGLADGLGKLVRIVRIEYDFWNPQLRVINF